QSQAIDLLLIAVDELFEGGVAACLRFCDQSGLVFDNNRLRGFSHKKRLRSHGLACLPRAGRQRSPHVERVTYSEPISPSKTQSKRLPRPRWSYAFDALETPDVTPKLQRLKQTLYQSPPTGALEREGSGGWPPAALRGARGETRWLSGR